MAACSRSSCATSSVSASVSKSAYMVILSVDARGAAACSPTVRRRPAAPQRALQPPVDARGAFSSYPILPLCAPWSWRFRRPSSTGSPTAPFYRPACKGMGRTRGIAPSAQFNVQSWRAKFCDLGRRRAKLRIDMISSGESMIDVARELKSRKAKRVFAFCT